MKEEKLWPGYRTLKKNIVIQNEKISIEEVNVALSLMIFAILPEFLYNRSC